MSYIIFAEIFNNNAMLWIEIQAKNELKKIRRLKRKKIRNYTLKDLIG
jgi:plasmid maintenance system antidote protein VapI